MHCAVKFTAHFLRPYNGIGQPNAPGCRGAKVRQQRPEAAEDFRGTAIRENTEVTTNAGNTSHADRMRAGS